MRSRRRPSDFSSTSRTSPKPLTIPLNIGTLALETLLAVGPNRLGRNPGQAPLKRLLRLRIERHHAVVAYDLGRVKQYRLINQVARNQIHRQRRPTLDHQARDATRPQRVQDASEIVSLSCSNHVDTLDAQRFFRVA